MESKAQVILFESLNEDADRVFAEWMCAALVVIFEAVIKTRRFKCLISSLGNLFAALNALINKRMNKDWRLKNCLTVAADCSKIWKRAVLQALALSFAFVLEEKRSDLTNPISHYVV